MKYKILMLPSWYPTKEDPVAGSFFKEQAQALAQYFDFFVALVTFPSFSFRSFLRQSLRRARISIDASTRLVPEIHCVAYSHMPERILRFFIRRDCFKGTVLKKAERLIEDHYDDRRCRTYLKVYRLLERDYGFKPDLIYAMTAQTNGVESLFASQGDRDACNSRGACSLPFPRLDGNREGEDGNRALRFHFVG